MQNTSQLVELRLPDTGGSIYGTLLRLDSQGAVIIRQNTPAQPPLKTGTPGLLRIGTGKALYQTDVQIVEEQNSHLHVAFTRPIHRTQRRNSLRRACNTSARFRALTANGRGQVWQNAVTQDISTGGLRLQVNAEIGIPDQMVVVFYLPNETLPIQATARFVRRTRQPDGSLSIGLAFTSLAPLDRIRLDRFARGETADAAA